MRQGQPQRCCRPGRVRPGRIPPVLISATGPSKRFITRLLRDTIRHSVTSWKHRTESCLPTSSRRRPRRLQLQTKKHLSGAPSPSCGTRRMTESAALLVDDVLPRQPIRQWVLSFPFQLRYLFANRPAVMGQVLGIVYRVLATHLTKKAGFTKQNAPDRRCDADSTVW